MRWSRIPRMLRSDFVALGLGSNRPGAGEDCVSLLKGACCRLSPIFSDFFVSSVYETRPMYVEDQPDFYNMVVCGHIRKEVEPEELLSFTQGVEAELGRNRRSEVRNGPRPMDIDIEFFGERRISTERLVLPHPRIRERSFVLCPLNEVLTLFFDGPVKCACGDFLGVDFSALGVDGIRLVVDSSDFSRCLSGIR